MRLSAALRRLFETLGAHIVGVTGPPGSGKTTLAQQITESWPSPALTMSLDDFYLSKTERAERNLRWRGAPGSHDLELLYDVLEKIRSRETWLSVPRFSAARDERVDPITVVESPDLVILEGWFLGYEGDGYGDIRRYLDLLVFLDIDIELARTRRFGREDELRARGGGFSETEMQRFWDEVLAPGIERLLPEAKRSSDVVVGVNADGHPRSVDGANRDAVATLRALVES